MRNSIRVGICCAMLAIAACGREGALVSTSTPLPVPSPPETSAPIYSAPPTESPTLAPTSTPSATSEATVTVEPPTPTPEPTAAPSKPELEFESLEGTDRVRGGDAGVHPDGQPDVVLTATLEGDVEELIATQCASERHASSEHQWDTITGEEAMPTGYSSQAGNATSVLGVIDSSDDFVNRSDGSLPTLHLSEPTRFELHFQNDGSVVAGRHICLTVVRPDRSVQVESVYAS